MFFLFKSLTFYFLFILFFIIIILKHLGKEIVLHLLISLLLSIIIQGILNLFEIALKNFSFQIIINSIDGFGWDIVKRINNSSSLLRFSYVPLILLFLIDSITKLVIFHELNSLYFVILIILWKHFFQLFYLGFS